MPQKLLLYSEQHGKLQMGVQTLSDNSKVYSVYINGKVGIACASQADADTLFDLLSKESYDIIPME